MEETSMATNPMHDDPARNWPQRGKAMSEEAYHRLEQRDPVYRYEYIQGRTYIVGGITVGHDRLRYNLHSLLDQQLTKPCVSFGSIVQVLLTNQEGDTKHFVYPDITVSCMPDDNLPHNDLIRSPRVVIEVPAPSTEWRDREVKFRAYQHCPTIQEIVFINQFSPLVEVWRRDKRSISCWYPVQRYSQFESPGEAVAFNSVNVQIALEEIYQNSDFGAEIWGIDEE
jgi:Uma2 family endonuclease